MFRWDAILGAEGRTERVVAILALILAVPGAIVAYRELTRGGAEQANTVEIPTDVPARIVERSPEDEPDPDPTDVVGEGGKGGSEIDVEPGTPDRIQPPPQPPPGTQGATPRSQPTSTVTPPSPDQQNLPMRMPFRITREMIDGLPSEREISRAYPRRIRMQGTARVVVSCQPHRNGSFGCEIASSTDPRFNQAALSLLRGIRLQDDFQGLVASDTPAHQIQIVFQDQD